MKWFVLYTSPRAEKQVAKRLLDRGLIVYLPLHKVLRKWSDRKKVVEEPLFCSYLFVYCSEADLRTAVTISGVCNVLYYLGKPAVVKEYEIESIKEFLKMAESREVISLGDTVEIIDGAFSSEQGKILRIDKDSACLILEKLGVKILVSLHDINKNNKK